MASIVDNTHASFIRLRIRIGYLNESDNNQAHHYLLNIHKYLLLKLNYVVRGIPQKQPLHHVIIHGPDKNHPHKGYKSESQLLLQVFLPPPEYLTWDEKSLKFIVKNDLKQEGDELKGNEDHIWSSKYVSEFKGYIQIKVKT